MLILHRSTDASLHMDNVCLALVSEQRSFRGRFLQVSVSRPNSVKALKEASWPLR